jgi:hypothetical protein
MAYEIAARVHVAVHGTQNPGDAEWSAYLAHIGANLRAIDAIFGVTAGGGPNAAQREQAVAFWRAQPRALPIAVVTGSRLVARMAGALRWFMPTQIKVFGPGDMNAACAYVRLDPAQRATLDAALARLTRALAAGTRGAAE